MRLHKPFLSFCVIALTTGVFQRIEGSRCTGRSGKH